MAVGGVLVNTVDFMLCTWLTLIVCTLSLVGGLPNGLALGGILCE